MNSRGESILEHKKEISLMNENEEHIIEDIRNTEFSLMMTLRELYQVMRLMFKNEELKDYDYLMIWDSLSINEKIKKYD